MDSMLAEQATVGGSMWEGKPVSAAELSGQTGSAFETWDAGEESLERRCSRG